MGYYWDYVERKYFPIDHDRMLSQPECWVLEGRGELIDNLLQEVGDPANAITCLYATLLVRALASSDEVLARDFSERVAKATAAPELVKSKTRRAA